MLGILSLQGEERASRKERQKDDQCEHRLIWHALAHDRRPQADAGMGERQQIKGIFQGLGHIIQGEEGTAKKGHGGDDDAGEHDHIIIRAGQKSGEHSQKRKYQTGQYQAQEERSADVKLRPDEQGHDKKCDAADATPQDSDQGFAQEERWLADGSHERLIEASPVDLIHHKPGSRAIEAAVHGRHGDDSGNDKLQIAHAIHLDAPAQAKAEGRHIKNWADNRSYQVMGQVSPQGDQIGPEDGIGSLGFEQQVMHQSDHGTLISTLSIIIPSVDRLIRID